MKKWIYIVLGIVLALFAFFLFTKPVIGPDVPEGTSELEIQPPTENRIFVTNIKAGDEIDSPLVIEGEARGLWYFEASFPVVLVDWDGKIIAQGIATAEEEWMTDSFVPFTAEITFTKPEFDIRGAIILQRDNPSGLPENDAALEIPIKFKP